MVDNTTPKDILVRNTIYNIIGSVWTKIIAIFIQSYIINRLGLEKYGILVTLTVFVSWSRALDFGFSNSLVKFFGQAYAVKDTTKFNKTMTTSIYFYFLWGLVLLTPSTIYGELLTKLFIKAPSDEVILFFKITVLNIVLNNIAAIFGYCIISLQRLAFANKASIALSPISVLGTIFVLENGYGIIGLAWLGALMALLNIIIYISYLKYSRVDISLVPKNISKDLTWEIFSFGYPLEISYAFNMLFFQTDRYIISRVFNQIKTVSLYQVGCSVITQVRETILLIISAVLPAAVDLAARKEEKSLMNLFIRGSKYLTIAAFPCFLFIMLFAREILTAWIGPRLLYEDKHHIAANILRIVTIGYTFNLISGTATSMGVAIGKPRLELKTDIYAMIVTILTYIFVRNLSEASYRIAVSITVGLTFMGLYYFVLLHKYIRFEIKAFLKEVFINPGILAIISILPACVIKFFEIKYGIGNGWLSCLIIVIVSFGVAFATFLIAALKFKILDEYDKNTIKDMFKRYIFRNT